LLAFHPELIIKCYYLIAFKPIKMINRLVPWRSKPPEFLDQLIDEAVELRLYLLSEIGPTQFLFKDNDSNKFKVSLGSIISCSCGANSAKEHCVHSIYVLIKKFKVALNSPILYQAGYTDSEIASIVTGEFSEKAEKEPGV